MNRKLPSGAAKIAKNYPEIWAAYEKLGAACAEAGPFDARTIRLVKLALAVAAESEGAVHSHARRALDEGVPKSELLQVALLAISDHRPGKSRRSNDVDRGYPEELHAAKILNASAFNGHAVTFAPNRGEIP